MREKDHIAGWFIWNGTHSSRGLGRFSIGKSGLLRVRLARLSTSGPPAAPSTSP